MDSKLKRIASFFVSGKPQPRGSKNALPYRKITGDIGVRVLDANPKSYDWMAFVSYEARQAYTGQLLTGALGVEMVFGLQRPKSHYRTGRNANKLKPSAPKYPIFKPDVLKLTRAVEDALTGIVWKDDAQIVYEVIGKVYATPGVRVTVYDMMEEK